MYLLHRLPLLRLLPIILPILWLLLPLLSGLRSELKRDDLRNNDKIGLGKEKENMKALSPIPKACVCGFIWSTG